MEPEDIIDDSSLSEYFEIQLVITNSFGEFRGLKANLPKIHCDKIVEMAKTFYIDGGFELTCEDGSLVIFPPQIVQKSILKINKIPLEVDNQQET